MSWDSYIRAVLRIELPGRTLRIKPADLERSPADLGRSPDADFSDVGDGTVYVITAYNPAGRVVPDEANTAAHQRLTARLEELGATHHAAAGGDVEWVHVEPGFAIVGMSQEDARALGREFGQEAIFGLSSTTLTILSCETTRMHVTGWDVDA